MSAYEAGVLLLLLLVSMGVRRAGAPDILVTPGILLIYQRCQVAIIIYVLLYLITVDIV